MKFLGYSEKDSEHHGDGKSKHYTFHIGPQELVILRDIVDYIHRIVPRSLFTQPFTSRLGAMRTEIHKVIRELNVKLPPRPRGWDPRDPTETF